MPRIPYNPVPDLPARQVAPADTFHINVVPAAFGSTVGQAVEHLGGTLQKSGDELFNRAVAFQQLRNETEAQDLTSNTDFELAKARDSYLRKQGINASRGLDDHLTELRKIRDDGRANASNGEVARRYDSQTLRSMFQSMVVASSHSASEFRKARADSTNTAMERLVDRSQYVTDNQFQENLQELEGLSREGSRDVGHTDGSAEQQALKWTSRAWAARIKKTVDEDPPKAYQMMVDGIKEGRFHSQDLPGVVSRVNSALNQTQSRVIARNVLNEPNDPEGFIKRRFPNADVRGINPDFAQRFITAIGDFETQAGKMVRFPHGSDKAGVRSYEVQAELHDKWQAYIEGRGPRAPLAADPDVGRHVEGRGEAFDVPLGQFREWLSRNAQRYGLEFLHGWDPNVDLAAPGSAYEKDLVHVQLARGANFNPPAKYQIPEKHFVDRGVAMAKGTIGDVPDEPSRNQAFLDATAQKITSDFHQQRVEENGQRRNDNITLSNEFVSPNIPPRSPEELRARGPEAQRAYDNLDAVGQRKWNDYMLRKSGQPTASERANYLRLSGMSSSMTGATAFADTKLDEEDLAPTDRLKLLKIQQAMEKNQWKADARWSHASPVVSSVIPDTVSRTGTDWHILKGAMIEAIENWQRMPANINKYPNDDELRTMARNIYLTPPEYQPKTLKEISDERFEKMTPEEHDTYRQGVGLEDVWHYLTQPGKKATIFEQSKSISTADKERIREELTSRGFTPDDDHLQRAFIAEQLEKLKSKPK